MNLFDLYAKISLDTGDYERGLSDASSKTSAFAEKLKTGLTTAAKVGGAALVTAATAFGALSKSAVDGYAEYEQLVGGIETLFKTSSDTVMQYAANAYTTAGLSANAYMETVTSFSASLLQGLGGDTAAAAQIANLAVTDMADNANKMGTAIGSIQYAYQGFAKQNYTMLDNLKLGYGGTAAEMARLINDSGVLGNAVKVTAESVNSVPFDQIIQAIHTIQTNIGMTGTTANEASSTIQGSVSAMQSAWTNFLTGMADPAQDFGSLVDNLVNSIVVAADNIVPRLQELLPRLSEGLTSLVQGLIPHIPPMLQTLLPALISGATALLNGFTTVLPAIITTAINAIPQLTEAAGSIISNLLSALINAAPQLLQVGGQLIMQISNGIINGIPQFVSVLPNITSAFTNFLTGTAPQIIQSGIGISQSLTDGIVNAIPSLVSALPQIITAYMNFITSQLPVVIDSGVEMLKSLADGILDAIPQLVAQLPQIITAFIQFVSTALPSIVDSGMDLLIHFANGIIDTIPKLVAQLPQIINAFVQGISGALPKILQSGVGLLQKFIEGILSAIPKLVSALPQIISAIVQGIGSLMGGIVNIGKSIVEGIWQGISNMAGWIKSKVTGFFSGIVNGVKGLLGIHSPSKVFADMGKNSVLGFGDGWDDEFSRVKKSIESDMNFNTAKMDVQSSYGSSSGVSSQGAGMIVSITINGAKYSDENALAQAISERLAMMSHQRGAVYA